MSLRRILILPALLILLLGSKTFGQKKAHREDKSVSSKSRFINKTSREKGGKAKMLCPAFASENYPYQGIGLKLGDPFALTYKYYFNRYFSVAADVGKASSSLYSRYYMEKFGDYIMRDTLSGGATLNYLTSKIKLDWIGEIKVLYSFDAKRISPGLQIYAGLGIQAKNAVIKYDYLYSKNVQSFGSFDRSRFTLGQTTVLGIEYAYFQLPISAFIEMELFTDIQHDPGWQCFQGGIGMRYIFK